jgi:peptidoglycan hydrolase-like protein with peptidoglycan-binding domain
MLALNTKVNQSTLRKKIKESAMDDIKNLIKSINLLNEAQKHEFLDAIVDRYAKEGMTLQDLQNMERDASEARPPEGLLSGFITPSYRVRYTLAHAADKLGLPGLYNERGNFVYLDDNGEAAGARGASRGDAEQLARVGLLPQDKAQRFNIQNTPTEEPAQDQEGGAETFPVEPPANIQSRPLDRNEPTPNSAQGPSDSLEQFAARGQGGLMRRPQETNAIRELQTFLTQDLGLDTGSVDGKYGPKTRQSVAQFQRAVTGIQVDGDAGPETIGKIQEIRSDMSRLEQLIAALDESIISVKFSSSIAKLLERDLSQDEQRELEQLVSKYRNFRQAFPEFKKDSFERAGSIVGQPNAQTDTPNQPTQPNIDNPSSPPYVPGRDPANYQDPDAALVRQEPPRPPAQQPGNAPSNVASNNTDVNVGLVPRRLQSPENVRPRPTSGAQLSRRQRGWDRQYAATHNADGTPKTTRESTLTQSVDLDNVNYIKEMVRKICK